MKVGIITVFDAVNYGSFLQAYCLQKVLKEMGNDDITMIKTSSFLYEKWRITSLISYLPKKIHFKSRLAKGYLNCWKGFRTSRRKKGYDLVIVGSDEMWELNNITMRPLPVFFGVGVEAKKIVSYAVSSNTTKKTDIERHSYIKEGLSKFDSISVRDKSTFDAYQPQVDKIIEYCIDPTLLISLQGIADEGIRRNDYILCYTYTFQPSIVQAVTELARKLKKKIIVAGQNFPWADECIPANPFEFLGLIKNADFVITDTFHGTVLSIAFNKQFVTFAYKEKVRRIVEQFGLADRDVTGQLSILDKYDEMINYERINAEIDKLRETSLKFLGNCLRLK